MNIADQFLENGRDNDEAILYDDSVISYFELRNSTNLIVNFISDKTTEKNLCIGIFSENSAFFVYAYLAIMKSGNVAVPLNVNSSESSLAGIITSLNMKYMFVSKTQSLIYYEFLNKIKIELWSENDLNAVEGLADVPVKKQSVNVNPCEDLAAIMFTSGSTGEPKGVMISHRNIECNTDDIIAYMNLCRSDRVMCVLPFYYCFGTSLLHTHLKVGGSIVINNKFLFAEKVLDDLEKNNCTGIAGVPSHFQILLRKTTFLKRSLSSLKWIQQAGGKLPNPYIKQIIENLPDVNFFIMYGQTEGTARLSYLPPRYLNIKLGSIGKGLQSTKLDLVSNDGIVLQPGSKNIGEIVASGDNVTLGYWNDDAETNKFFKGGKLFTGDIAKYDSDGFIYIVEREREFIKSMGNRVSAKQIEDVIAEIEDVVELAVVGLPDELWGEVVTAIVILKEGSVITENDIRDYCNRNLPNYMVPQKIIFRDNLPKNSFGKISKFKLIEFLR